MSGIKCPSCGLYSPGGTEVCECGQGLETGAPAAAATSKRGDFVQAGLLIAILLVLVASAVLSQVRSAQAWEYRIESPSDEEFAKSINAFGAEGWELVFARRATSGEGATSKASYEMIFKRPALGAGLGVSPVPR